MSDRTLERLAEWVKTGPGRRWFETVDREASAREDAVVERHAMVKSIADARREQREEMPRLKELVAKAAAVAEAAKEQYEKADRARYEAAMEESACFDRVRQRIRSAEARLRATCDPRLDEAREVLGHVRRDWDRIWNTLAQRSRAGEFMTLRTIITNKAELDAAKKEIDDADDAIERFKLIAEPTEQEILAIVARAHAAVAAVGRPAYAEIGR